MQLLFHLKCYYLLLDQKYSWVTKSVQISIREFITHETQQLVYCLFIALESIALEWSVISDPG